MLGIHRNRSITWRNWFGVWFEILDSLFNILTFGFCNFSVTTGQPRFYSFEFIFERQCYPGIRNQIKWWVIAWVQILQCLFTILTLGYLYASWFVNTSNWIINLGRSK